MQLRILTSWHDHVVVSRIKETYMLICSQHCSLYSSQVRLKYSLLKCCLNLVISHTPTQYTSITGKQKIPNGLWKSDLNFDNAAHWLGKLSQHSCDIQFVLPITFNNCSSLAWSDSKEMQCKISINSVIEKCHFQEPKLVGEVETGKCQCNMFNSRVTIHSFSGFSE